MKSITIGSAAIDSIAIIESDRIERMAMHNADTSYLLLEEGRKIEASEISNHCGGGAVNTAVSMARLGLDVSTIIKMGVDQRADTILDRLNSEHISTQWVRQDKKLPTGASVLISSHERNAAVFTFRGANTLLKPEDLHDEAFAVDLAYISTLSNESADCFPLLIQKAKAQKALVATNPGIRQLSARTGPFYDSLKDIDILSLNQTEAAALVPHLVGLFGEGGPNLPLTADEEPPSLIRRGLSAGGFEMSIAHFVCAILSQGPKYVLITAGGEGAFLASANGLLHCPALPVEVAGTAGCGDAFASTFSAFITMGRSADEAMRAASINAASVASFVDTQTGLLDIETLQERITETENQLIFRHWDIQAAGLCKMCEGK